MKMSSSGGQTESCHDGDQEKEKKERRLREIRAQIEQIKQQIQETDGRQQSTTSTESRTSQDDNDRDYFGNASEDKKRNTDLSSADSFRSPQEAKQRQRETIEKVTSFKNKLKEISKTKAQDPSLSGSMPTTSCDGSEQRIDDELNLDLVDGDSWLTHRLEANDEEPTSDFEDHEEERLSRRQPRESGRSDREVPERERHRHRHRSRSTSKGRRESGSRALSRERRSGTDHNHRHRHRHRHRHHDEKSHRSSSSERDRQRDRRH